MNVTGPRGNSAFVNSSVNMTDSRLMISLRFPYSCTRTTTAQFWPPVYVGRAVLVSCQRHPRRILNGIGDKVDDPVMG